MDLVDPERSFVAAARVARLATVTPGDLPHVVPVCFALTGNALVSALDAKPKTVAANRLQRVANIEHNPTVALLVDRYRESWDELGWVRVDGHAEVQSPDHPRHAGRIDALRQKYDQYASHPLEARPLIVISPEQVRSWGTLEEPPSAELT